MGLLATTTSSVLIPGSKMHSFYSIQYIFACMSWIRWYILLGVCSVFLLLKGTGSRKECGFKKWNHLWSGCWVSPFGTPFLLLSRTCHLFEKMYCLIENHFHLGRKTNNACKCQLRIIARPNYGFCPFNHWLNDIYSMALYL